MVDARLPERWLQDERFDGLSDGAWRLFTGALMWCNQQQNDGVLTARAFRFIYPGLVEDDMVGELLAEGLWTQTTDGYVVSDWSVTQTTAAVLEARRVKSRETSRANRSKGRTAVPSGVEVTGKPRLPASVSMAGDVTGGVTGGVTGHAPGQDRTGQDRAGEDRAGQDRPASASATSTRSDTESEADSSVGVARSSGWPTVSIPRGCAACDGVLDPSSPSSVCPKQDHAHRLARHSSAAA